MKPVKFVPFYKPKDAPSRPRTFACESCRRKKIKCSSTHPECDSCRKRGIPCVYKDPNAKPMLGTIGGGGSGLGESISASPSSGDLRAKQLAKETDEAVSLRHDKAVMGKELEPWSIREQALNAADAAAGNKPGQTLSPTPRYLPAGVTPKATRPLPPVAGGARPASSGWTSSPIPITSVSTPGTVWTPSSLPCESHPGPRSWQEQLSPMATDNVLPPPFDPHPLSGTISRDGSSAKHTPRNRDRNSVPSVSWQLPVNPMGSPLALESGSIRSNERPRGPPHTDPRPLSNTLSYSTSTRFTDPKSAQPQQLTFNLPSPVSHSVPSSPTHPMIGVTTAASASTATLANAQRSLHDSYPQPPPSAPPTVDGGSGGANINAPLVTTTTAFGVPVRPMYARDTTPTTSHGSSFPPGRARDSPHLARAILKTKPLTLASLASPSSPPPPPPLPTSHNSTPTPPTRSTTPGSLPGGPGSFMAMPGTLTTGTSFDQRLRLPFAASGAIDQQMGACLYPQSPNDVDVQLITDFFEYIHPQIPIFHRATLFQRLHERRVPLFILYAFYAAASRFSRRPMAVLTDAFTASEQYAKRARSLLAQVIETCHPLVLQALLVMSIYELGVGNVAQGMKYTECAISMAQDLGVNQAASGSMELPSQSNDPDYFNHWFDLELQRRIWWACIIIKISEARFFTKPHLLRLEDMPKLYPCDGWVWAMDRDHLERFALEPTTRSSLYSPVPSNILCGVVDSPSAMDCDLGPVVAGSGVSLVDHRSYPDALPSPTSLLSSMALTSPRPGLRWGTAAGGHLTLDQHRLLSAPLPGQSFNPMTIGLTDVQPEVYRFVLELMLILDQIVRFRYHLLHGMYDTLGAVQREYRRLEALLSQCEARITQQVQAMATTQFSDSFLGGSDGGILGALKDSAPSRGDSSGWWVGRRLHECEPLVNAMLTADKKYGASVFSMVILFYDCSMELNYDMGYVYKVPEEDPPHGASINPGHCGVVLQRPRLSHAHPSHRAPTAPMPLLTDNDVHPLTAPITAAAAETLRNQAWHKCVRAAENMTLVLEQSANIQIESVFGYVPYSIYLCHHILSLALQAKHPTDASHPDFNVLKIHEQVINQFQRFWSTEHFYALYYSGDQPLEHGSD